MKKKLKLLAGIAVILILFLLAGFAFYVRDYYHADPSVERYMGSLDNVYTEEIPEGLFLDGPGEDRALVFYPGGKVEYRAYLPLCQEATLWEAPPRLYTRPVTGSRCRD